MKRAALWSSAVAVLVCAILLWRGERPPEGVVSGDGAVHQTTGQIATGDAATAEQDAATLPGNTERSEVATGTPVSAAPTSRLSGRCVAAESGQPLAGCVVRLRAGERSLETTTQADGRFEFEAVAGRPASLALNCAERAIKSAWIEMSLTDNHVDLGDIAMHRGFQVRGRVTNRAGEPIPACTVQLIGFPVGIERQRQVPGHASAHTDGQGNFEVRRLIPAGTCSAHCEGMNAPVPYTIDAVTGAPPLLLVVDTVLRRISGMVVDDSGAPVPRVPLRSSMPRSSAMSGPEGRFTFETMAAGDGENLVTVVDPVHCDYDGQRHVAPWGTEDLRIVLPRNRNVTVEVVDDRGEPVHEFGVWLARPTEPLTNSERSIRAKGRHENGIAVVEHVRRGVNLLRVIPANPELAASAAEERFVPDDGPCHMKVVLRRMVPCPVEVVDPAGVGLAQVRVTLAEVPAAMPPLETVPYTFGRGNRLRTTYLEAMCEVSTDAAGRAVVHALLPLPRAVLRVTTKGRPEWFQEAPALSPDRTLRIVMAAGGAIEGKVRLHGEPNAMTKVMVMPAGSNEFPPLERRLAIAADGSFSIQGLPAGTWRVVLMVEVAHNSGAAQRSIPVPMLGTERLVEVREGATSRVELEARPRDRSTLRGTLAVIGCDPAGWRVTVANTAHPDAACGPFTVGADGTFVAERLPPGQYRVLARRPAIRGGLGRMCGDVFEVPAGVEVTRTFTLQPQRLILNLRFPDGSPVDLSWWLRQGVSREYGSDVERIVLDPAPESGFQVTCDPGGRSWSDPVVVPAGVAEHEATVIVPRPGF